MAKLTNTTIPNVSLNYQVILNHVEGRRTNFSYRYNPDGQTTQTTRAITHGFDWTHTLSPSTFYTVAVRQNYFDYKDLAYEDVFDPRYDAAGPARSDDSYATNAVIQGVDFTRFKQRTSTLLWKASLVSQVRRDHQLKAGMEMHFPTVEFGTPGYLVYSTVDGREQLVRHLNEPPDYPGVRKYQPVLASTFLQDQLEWNDFTVRGGWRLDWFDARAKLPSDLANPANAIAGAPRSELVPVSDKVAVSPRLGVAYPITERAGIHFAYGHFYQFPGLGQIFDNADYRVLRSLQAGGISYGVLGNPDVKPEKTVQYEFGYKQAVTEDLGIDASVFYKDIRDLLGVEFVSTYNGAEYARLTNVDFGNVVGYTIAADHRRIGPLGVQLDYTWQLAQGNASDPRETATRAAAGEDPRPRQVPFNWDQRHTLNLTAEIRREDSFSATGILRVASGQPFTPVLEAGFGNGLDANSGRKPAGVVIDLRGERHVSVFGRRGSAFGRIFNALDTRYFNGSVFNSTGSPYYSRFPAADRGALLDPTRFYTPRRIEVGITVDSGF